MENETVLPTLSVRKGSIQLTQQRSLSPSKIGKDESNIGLAEIMKYLDPLSLRKAFSFSPSRHLGNYFEKGNPFYVLNR